MAVFLKWYELQMEVQRVEACVIHAVGSYSPQTGLTRTIALPLVGFALIRENCYQVV